MDIKVDETHEFESPMDIQINESNEVWWASTIEYDLTVNGEEWSVRVAETPKGTDFYYFTENGWEPFTEEGEEPILDAIYEAWSDGELIHE